jgi:hypothetical protein
MHGTVTSAPYNRTYMLHGLADVERSPTAVSRHKIDFDFAHLCATRQK